MFTEKEKKEMRWGKLVKNMKNGNVYKLIEDMEGKTTIKAVNRLHWTRYELLTAWLRNWNNDMSFRERFSGDIEDSRAERENLITELRCEDLVPANIIRFISPDYQTKFEVADLENVIVDGKARKVSYIDEYHFAFLDTNTIYHICEFAELAERCNLVVKNKA